MSADNRRLLCATCGTELTTVSSPASAPKGEKTQSARQLLERWSSNSLLDPYGPVWKEKEKPSSGSPPSPKTKSTEPSKTESKPVFRVHGPHFAQMTEQNTEDQTRKRTAHQPSPAGSQPSPAYTQSFPRIHSAHQNQILSPHFDVQSLIDQEEPRKTNWVALAGQLLAYGGVGLLTIGTTLVIWGYFGGPENYAPTGWLITTAGQMLLFLGVITLISGGMEQTTDEVTRRIDYLGEKILRIEQSTRDHALHGPSIPPESFVEGGTESNAATQHKSHFKDAGYPGYSE